MSIPLFELYSDLSQGYDECKDCHNKRDTRNHTYVVILIMTPEERLVDCHNWLQLGQKICCDVCNQLFYDKYLKADHMEFLYSQISQKIDDIREAINKKYPTTEGYPRYADSITFHTNDSVLTAEYVESRIRLFCDHCSKRLTHVCRG
jgi:hypothetical protein